MYRLHRFSGNYKGDRTSVTEDTLGQGEPPGGRHLPTYKDITDKNSELSKDEELVKMFREILARRDAIDEE